MTTQPTPPTPAPHPPAGRTPQDATVSRRLTGDPRPHGAATATPPPAPKEIATLPPLPVLHHDVPLSERTGEPPRPWSVLAGLVLFCLAAAAVTGVYARHWWLAVHPDSYPSSAHLVQWAAPAPGKWLSLTLEGVLALVLVLVAGACAVAGYQAWIGWNWARIISITALALTGVAVLLFDLWALVAVVLALLGTVCVFLPETTRYFRYFEAHRAKREETYRNPTSIFYGRLPRFR